MSNLKLISSSLLQFIDSLQITTLATSGLVYYHKDWIVYCNLSQIVLNVQYVTYV